MKMRQIQVSEEYIETLCTKMLDWVKKSDSYSVPQFLQEKGIGYPYFSYIVHTNPTACNTFEVVKAILSSRWLHMAMTVDELPAHRAKVLMKYLRLYDSHAMHMEEESKKRIAEAEQKTQMQFLAEEYDRSELTEPYKAIYKTNLDKRRDKKKA